MKLSIICFFLCIGFCDINAQTLWDQIEQETIGLTYQVPNNWYLMSFVQDKICDCEGGTLNTSPDGSINMVIIYDEPSKLSKLRQMTIWDNFTLEPAPVEDIIQTDDFMFQKTNSTWQEDNQSQVIQYLAVSTNRAYVIYFWGLAEDIEQQNNILNRIIRSTRPF